MTIQFMKLTQEARLPSYAHASDSGMDIATTDSVIVCAGGTIRLRTGIAAFIPPGYELQVRPRSGLSKHGIVVHFGTIDESYRGEILIVLTNTNDYGFRIQEGDRIAQLVLAPVVHATIAEVTSLSTDTERGTEGFGSTGMQ